VLAKNLGKLPRLFFEAKRKTVVDFCAPQLPKIHPHQTAHLITDNCEHRKTMQTCFAVRKLGTTPLVRQKCNVAPLDNKGSRPISTFFEAGETCVLREQD